MKFPFSKFSVSGHSMLPTLSEGQDILSFNWAYLGKKPKIGDIIVIKYQGREMVKRIKGLEGEKVLVEGDNKEESTDSRHFGPINKSQIIGKVVYQGNEIPCPVCEEAVVGIYGRKDAICANCGFKLTCCGEP